MSFVKTISLYCNKIFSTLCSAAGKVTSNRKEVVMRPDVKGVVLTKRQEFVIVGQAFAEAENTNKTMNELEAISAAMGHLSVQQYEPETLKDPEWYIPYSDFGTHSEALGQVHEFYEKLRRKTDRGSYCENASPEYVRLSKLMETTEILWGGLLKGMGVPQV